MKAPPAAAPSAEAARLTESQTDPRQGSGSEGRSLLVVARPAVAPQHRRSIRDAVIGESHRAAAGEPDRLILHALLFTIRGHSKDTQIRA